MSTVRDLVERFEVTSTTPKSTSPQSRRSSLQASPLPPPSPARFIHPLLNARGPATPLNSPRTPLPARRTSRALEPVNDEPDRPVGDRERPSDLTPPPPPKASTPVRPSLNQRRFSREPARELSPVIPTSPQSDPFLDSARKLSSPSPATIDPVSTLNGSMRRPESIGSPKPPEQTKRRSTLPTPLHDSPTSAASSNPFTDFTAPPSIPSTAKATTSRPVTHDLYDPIPSPRTLSSAVSSKRLSLDSTSISRTFTVIPPPDIPLRPLTQSALKPLSAPSMYNSVPSSTPTLVSSTHRRNTHSVFPPHQPVPAKEVFARNAAPLHLPDLDEHLSLVPTPNFTPFPAPLPPSSKRKGKAKEQAIFPPMQLLQGHALDDLEHNSSVAPAWRNRNSLSGGIFNAALSLTSSSWLANFYSLQGIYDGVQVFALVLSSVVPHAGRDISDYWRKLFLGTIPNILALNFGTTLVQSLVFLVILMVISGALLYYFHIATESYFPLAPREGLQSYDRGRGWSLILVTLVLSVLYLPLSTIAVHALLWSSDFWVVENPYKNATSLPPQLPPLGPPADWRDPLDFCYTTTMNKSEINWAPIVVILAALTFIFMTLWFPLRLSSTIRRSLPKVDPYTELGKLRSKADRELEYQRLLARDQNPFNFLYNDFRRRWATYKATYLGAKLSALLIIAVLDPDTCLLRNTSRSAVDIARQSILTTAMLIWFLIQAFVSPFVDPVNNASEWTSRANYLATAAVGLGVSLKVPGSDVLNGPILYIIYIVTYALSLYFTFINFGWMHRIVKRVMRRIDFSIDIFSPHLDISPSSPHAKRRIWQESISTLLLTTPECRIPKSQRMEFATSPDLTWPPYLLDFQGSPAERHVENLKILRETGGLRYTKAVSLYSGPDGKRLSWIQRQIQRHHIGPDSYWELHPHDDVSKGCSKYFRRWCKEPSRYHSPDRKFLHGCARYFGTSWWVPFPPTLVIRFDHGSTTVLTKLNEFEEYLRQNQDRDILHKKWIRMSLRALDKQVVVWPYTHVELVGARTPWFWGRQYKMQSTVHYKACVLEIKHKGWLISHGVQLGSGFDIQLTYSRDLQLDGGILGLNDDFDLTPDLARFLMFNRHLIHSRSDRIYNAAQAYRRRLRREAQTKLQTLSYKFLSAVYNVPSPPGHVAKIVEESEQDPRVRNAVLAHEESLAAAFERISVVTESELATWWYLFWDDFWRRNHDVISALSTHAADFSPHYATSIAYRPLPRPALETFLIQRGIYSKPERWTDFISSGLLNKIYFRLNQIVFRGTSKDILAHLGDNDDEVDLEDIEFGSHIHTSTLGTGGGTDHDDRSIRFRPAYRWEAVYDDPLVKGKNQPRQRWWRQFGVWFGVTPLSTVDIRTNGISLDVALSGGQYVRVEGVEQKGGQSLRTPSVYKLDGT